MAKLTLTDLASLANQTSAVNTINNNSALIETALENTLSRDGTTPNTMTADIDMNSNDLLNVGVVNAAQVKVGGVDANLLGDVTVKGAWLTGTAYVQLDLVTEAGATYICLEDHTSGTFSTDLAANKWAVIEASYDPAAVAITGGTIAGAVTLDGVAANTLLNDTDIGVNVQAYDADIVKSDVNTVMTAQLTGSHQSVTSTSNSVAVNFNNGQDVEHTLTENTTIAAPTNGVDGTYYLFQITQDASTARTLAWNVAYEFIDDTAPTMPTTLGAKLFVLFRNNGGTLTEVGRTVEA